MSKYEHVDCPFCHSSVEVDVAFAAKNGRISCNCCCKAFDIFIKEDEIKDESEQKEVVEEKTIAEKFDEGVKEILKDEDDGWFWV